MRGERRGPIGNARATSLPYKARVSRRKTDEGNVPIEGLPKEVGVLLVVAGIGGLLLPGPVGTPFLLLGGVTLWPAAFRRVEPVSRSGFHACIRWA